RRGRTQGRRGGAGEGRGPPTPSRPPVRSPRARRRWRRVPVARSARPRAAERPRAMPLLPDDVPPMLCTIGTAFDDDAFLFEVKWDGVRALAYVDDRGLRVHSRNRRDLAGRYPELQA